MPLPCLNPSHYTLWKETWLCHRAQLTVFHLLSGAPWGFNFHPSLWRSPSPLLRISPTPGSAISVNITGQGDAVALRLPWTNLTVILISWLHLLQKKKQNAIENKPLRVWKDKRRENINGLFFLSGNNYKQISACPDSWALATKGLTSCRRNHTEYMMHKAEKTTRPNSRERAQKWAPTQDQESGQKILCNQEILAR